MFIFILPLTSFPRIMNDIDLALMANQEGMRAVLIKSHVALTAEIKKNEGKWRRDRNESKTLEGSHY